MASYGKFQSDNAKYTNKLSRSVTYNPDFNPTIDVVGNSSKTAFERNLHKWAELVAFYRWNPDLWYNLLTPETGAIIKLDLDQRVELRCLARFKSTYDVKPRGSGKTLVAMMYAFHTGVFYPGVELALTAQTRENSAKIISDKYAELIKAFPLLRDEIYSYKFSGDTVEILFHNGSRIINIAAAQSSKGAHVHRGLVDEDNLTNEEIYLDVLEPIFTTVKRKTVGKACVVDPMEMNGSVSPITSSGFRGSPAFYRCLRHFDHMIALKGEMCLGASWELPCFYGRGATKAEVLAKKERNSAISFAMNYGAEWTGCSDGALVSIAKLIDCRTLVSAEQVGKPDGEYVIGMDIARSDNAGNNQTSFVVLKVIRKSTGRVKEVQMVNMVTVKGTLDFEAQTLMAKKIMRRFGASMLVFDDNGIGKAAGDLMVREQTDPVTGEIYPCYRVVGSERIPDDGAAEPKAFSYMAQKYDNESIANFMDYVETGKLRLLEKKLLTEYSEEDMPFLQTDFFVEEVANLKLKHLSNGGLSIERLVAKMNKDRFSAVQYALWYVKTYMDKAIVENTADDETTLAALAMWY